MCAICARLHEGDPVRVTFQLLDYDTKRIHYFQQLFHATDGWVSATSENMTLHVDMTAKKVAPFPETVMRTLCAHEGRACAPAAPRGRRPQHRDAGEELALASIPNASPLAKAGVRCHFQGTEIRLKASMVSEISRQQLAGTPAPAPGGIAARARAQCRRRPISPA